MEIRHEIREGKCVVRLVGDWPRGEGYRREWLEELKKILGNIQTHPLFVAIDLQELQGPASPILNFLLMAVHEFLHRKGVVTLVFLENQPLVSAAVDFGFLQPNLFGAPAFSIDDALQSSTQPA